MKTLGIIRTIDSLGRLVIPREYLKRLNINEEPLEITLTNAGILIQKPKPFCQLCGKNIDIKKVNNGHICISCIDEIKAL